MEAATDAGITQEEEEVLIDAVAVDAPASVADLHLAPPASYKKRLAGMDPDVTRT